MDYKEIFDAMRGRLTLHGGLLFMLLALQSAKQRSRRIKSVMIKELCLTFHGYPLGAIGPSGYMGSSSSMGQLSSM